MTPILAELPDSGYILLGCIVVALVGLAGLAALLRGLQSLRTGIAEELKREIESAKTPSPVSVQQPLEVTQALRFTTKEEHDRHVLKVEDEFRRERSSRKLIYEKIENQGTEIAGLKKETEFQTRQLGTLDTKMDQVLLRLPRPPGT